MLQQDAYVEHLGLAKGFLLAAKDYLEMNDIESVYIVPIKKQATNELMKVLSLSENKLRK